MLKKVMGTMVNVMVIIGVACLCIAAGWYMANKDAIKVEENRFDNEIHYVELGHDNAIKVDTRDGLDVEKVERKYVDDECLKEKAYNSLKNSWNEFSDAVLH